MATTAAEQSKTRADLAQLAGVGPVSPIAILAGVLVGYATFALFLGGTVAVLERWGSDLDLTASWEKLTRGGGLTLAGLLFVSHLWAGYVAGRMGWRRGILHGLGVFVGSILVVGAVAWIVRTVAKPDDVEAVSEALRTFGVPTTREEWRYADSFAGVASLGAMLLGSVLGGFLGGRWFTKLSRRAQTAEVDVRERLETTNSGRRSRATTGNGNGNGNGNGRRSSRTAKVADLDELTKEELYELAQELEIPGRSQMAKDELKDALASAMQLQS
jgi:hypothetical protein